MKRAYSLNTNTDENSTASSIRPLKTNYLRMKKTSRRNFLKAAAMVVVYAGVTAAPVSVRGDMAAAGTAGDKKANGKFNVLFLMTDEQHYRSLSLTGNPYITTPNMDRIGREGVLFSNATCVTPFCSPSRASLITGVYPYRHGILSNVDKGGKQAALKQNDFPNTETILYRHGYATAHFGKWHLGNSGDFDCYESVAYLSKESSQEHKRLLDKQLPITRFANDPSPGKYLDRPVEMIPAIAKAYRVFGNVPPIAVIGRTVVPPALLPETRITDDAIRQIEQHAHEQFMITVSWQPPHNLWVIPEPYYSMVDRKKIKLPGSHDLPAWEAHTASKRLGDLAGDEGLREFAAVYYGQVKYIDDQVGRILRKLDELGLTEKTLVIFTTDHGDMVGAHGCIGKSIIGIYDDLLRIPFEMRLPGVIKPGTVVRQPVSQIDVMPTILDYVGQPAPEQLQGQSLRPLIEGRDVPWRDYAFCQRDNFLRMVRTDHYKYTFGLKPKLISLFDLKADPEENQNLADLPRNADLVRQMHRRLLDVMKAGGDPLLKQFPTDPLKTP